MKEANGQLGCIAVFDVGKTNKKLLVYDRELNLVDSLYAQFDEVREGSEIHERIAETTEWYLSALADMTQRHAIQAVSVSAHGATFVCIDGEGKLALPVLSYTTDPGEAFHAAFDARFGDARVLQRQTATPSLPGLGCMAKGLFYVMEHHPADFARTKAILNLPQYYGFLLTGKMGVEQTYLGSHTGLWDFGKHTWSGVVERLGIQDKLPAEVHKPWDVLGTVAPEIARRTGLQRDTIVTLGIHDSNGSLLPYLITVREPFVLLSTGSVCVVMHPTQSATLRDDELGKVVFYNLSAFGDPVKTTIFLAGLEFDMYMGLLWGRHGQKDYPAFDQALLEDILSRPAEFILPAIVPFGMFPDSPARIIERTEVYPFGDVAQGKTPSFFADYEKTYAILTLSIALQTRVALARAGYGEGMPVFIEGGFSRNEVYTNLIASLYPLAQVVLTNLKEASAFGAALLALSALEGVHPEKLRDRFAIETNHIAPLTLKGLHGYGEAFGRHLKVS
jgi:sugar (pentulose or hexulose) kinase